MDCYFVFAFAQSRTWLQHFEVGLARMLLICNKCLQHIVGDLAGPARSQYCQRPTVRCTGRELSLTFSIYEELVFIISTFSFFRVHFIHIQASTMWAEPHMLCAAFTQPHNVDTMLLTNSLLFILLHCTLHYVGQNIMHGIKIVTFS